LEALNEFKQKKTGLLRRCAPRKGERGVLPTIVFASP